MENEQKNLSMNKEQETVALQNANGGVGATESSEESVQAKKKLKQSNKTPILIGVIIVLVLCLAGAITWGVIMTQKANENAVQEDAGRGEQGNESVDKPVDDNNGELSEAEIDAEVRRIRNLAKAELAGFWSQYGDVEMIDIDDAAAVSVFYKMDDMITPVVLNKAYGVKVQHDNVNLGINYTAVYDEIYAKIESLLVKEGFVDTGLKYSLSSSGPSDSVFVNDKTGVVCNVSMDARVACGHKTWYDVDDAELSEELAQAVLTATGEDPEIVVARVKQIKDSEVMPYQTIKAVRHGFRSMFYRVSPESSWQYFRSGQDGPACEEYTTDDLRKAFVGEACYAQNEQTWKEVTVGL